MWELTRFAVDFFQQYLPFAEMESADQLTTREDDYCFAKRGSVYAIYLPQGGSTEVDLEAGRFLVRWFNPRRGGSLKNGTPSEITGPGKGSTGPPPKDPDRDWVCLITRQPQD